MVNPPGTTPRSRSRVCARFRRPAPPSGERPRACRGRRFRWQSTRSRDSRTAWAAIAISSPWACGRGSCVALGRRAVRAAPRARSACRTTGAAARPRCRTPRPVGLARDGRSVRVPARAVPAALRDRPARTFTGRSPGDRCAERECLRSSPGDARRAGRSRKPRRPPGDPGRPVGSALARSLERPLQIDAEQRRSRSRVGMRGDRLSRARSRRSTACASAAAAS